MDPHEDLRSALPKPTSPRELAGWALAVSLLPCTLGFLYAPFLAVVALRRLRAEPGRGRLLAVGAIVASAGWLLVLALAVVLPGPGDRTPPAATPNPPGVAGDDSVGSLHPGDCLRRSPVSGSLNYTVQVVDCVTEHRAEVYARFDLERTAFPGDDAVQARADEGCVNRFVPYVGAAIEQTGFVVGSLLPSRDGWPRERGVVCLLETDGPTTVSARDSGPASADAA